MPSETALAAATWFSTATPNALSEINVNLSLSASYNPSIPKFKFLRARKAVVEVLASRPGRELLATKKIPRGIPR